MNLNCILFILLIVVCIFEVMCLCVVEELLNKGVSVNLLDGNRMLLIVVCFKGYLEIVEKLIKVGVCVN